MKFCRLYGFRGSYALSGFFDQPELNPYTKKTIRKYQGFSGATSPRAIEKFVSKGCPSLIVRANTTEELQDMVFSSDSNVVVILADKDTPTMYYKTLAVRFSRHALKFVYVRSSDEELSQAFPDATQYPAVLVYSQGEATLYEEDVMERAELIDWLKTFAGEELEDNSNKSHENSDDLLVKMKELEGSESRPMSRVVAIVREKANSEVPNWLKFIDEADSAVEFREVRCSSDDQMHAMYSALCQSDAQELPYLLVLPYGLVDKKTVLKFITLIERRFDFYVLHAGIEDAFKALSTSYFTGCCSQEGGGEHS